MNKLENVYQNIAEENKELFSMWIENILFTPKWWIMLALLIIPWVLLFFVVKDRGTWIKLLPPILFSTLFAFFIDYLGVSYGFWYYVAKVAPFSIDIPWDFTLTPVFVALFLIIKPRSSIILKGILLAAIVSFIAEPLFNFFGFYVYLKWQYIYSFPLYFILYLISLRLYNLSTDRK